MSHSHSHDHVDLPVDPRIERSMWIAVGCCAIAVIIGLVALWPGSSSGRVDPLGLEGDPIRAEVTSVELLPCSYDALLGCRLIEIVPSEGPDTGQRLTFEQGLDSPIGEGDAILVDISTSSDGTLLINFYDFQRSNSLMLLVLVFVAAIVLLGRWKGVGALAGLAASLVVIIAFVLPAVLEGSNAVAVALVAAGAIAFLALFLAHGFNLATAAALLSSIASLALTALLAWAFVNVANLTGLANESIGFLGALGTDINPEGLLLAGIVIGSLGVLDDVTVTQVSAVWELKHARPDADTADLYRRAVRIGRDHISSTVNTLFLAYAGAALPLLLLFQEAGQSITSVATREVVAVEVVRALVGSIGLVASVPISTALAATVVGTVTATGSTDPFDQPPTTAEQRSDPPPAPPGPGPDVDG